MKEKANYPKKKKKKIDLFLAFRRKAKTKPFPTTKQDVLPMLALFAQAFFG